VKGKNLHIVEYLIVDILGIRVSRRKAAYWSARKLSDKSSWHKNRINSI